MTLQMLLDERDIVRGLSRFARILDSKSWDRLCEVFAEDLSFDYGAAGEQQGIDALRATMTRYLDRCGPTQHLIGSILVEVDGDTARSRAYVQARHQAAENAGGAVFDSSGEYVDHWRRRPAAP
jgi:3-phenylpropionate/cinnamic acid dioxygenase small subunit